MIKEISSISILSGKLNGFTLVESLVALSIIMLVTAMGLLISLQVLKSDAFLLKLAAKEEVNNIFVTAILHKELVNKIIETDKFIIEKDVSFYKRDNRLVKIEIKATTPDKRLLFSRTKIIRIE